MSATGPDLAATGYRTDPLVLTLSLDGASFALLDDLRRRHFPPERNRVPAHLTLFHALPGAEVGPVSRELDRLARRQAPFRLGPATAKPLGRGTALAFSCAALDGLRRDLAREWEPWLTPQDAGGFRAHVTVQNKVAPAEARRLLAELRAAPPPLDVRAEGLQLWHYRGGPWDSARRFRFAGR